MKTSLSDLIKKAQQLGLPDRDIENSKEFLKYNEFELCLEVIATQLYEFDIKIDREFYDKTIMVLGKMRIDPEKYTYLKELLLTEISPPSK